VFAEALISAPNHAEVLAKLVDHGQPVEDAIAGLRELDLEVVAFDRAQAEIAAGVRVEVVR
jgi:PIN domain nuclease of toxin-antitoxin system